jgi:divalent metal cation (Fe/Co/Zn/Cd) transporter
VTPQHQQANSRAVALSIFSNAVLIVLKLTVGIMIQSVNVISEAVHSGLDLVAAVIAWFAVSHGEVYRTLP